MSWHRVHRRHQLVHAVLAEVTATGQPVIPPALRAQVDAEFGDFGEFLREVQDRWYRAYDARLDAVLEEGPADMRAALIQLWYDLALVQPAARFLLDSHAGHWALAARDHHHRRRLYATTGVDLDLPRPSADVTPLLTGRGGA